jgi:antitoxin VapB
MRTCIFQSGKFQAVQIPKEIEFDRLDVEYEIERQGNMIIIRPVRTSLVNILDRFSAFSDDFMAEGRPDQGTQERETV